MSKTDTKKNDRVLTFNQSTKNAVMSARPAKKCCKRAYLLGILLFGQVFSETEIRLVAENEATIDHVCSMIKNICKTDVSEYKECFSSQTKLCIKDAEICKKILSHFGCGGGYSAYTIPKDIFICEKCRVEFLKGVFVSCGNVSDPEKSYHLEMNVSYFNLSRELLFFLKGLFLEAKYTKRASHYVIYYKESEKIVDFLGYIGATQENFEYYNTMITRDVRNSLNRLTNCETANLSKQISTATKQIDAIEKLFASGMADSLPKELLETARLRLENPDVSLAVLATLHEPPVTKSCVNRRLKKLCGEA